MADIVTSRIFQDGEKNITAVKMNDIIGSSVIQPAFVSSKPSTSTIASTDNLLVLQTAGTYVKAPFQTVIDSVSAGINSDTEIWNVRLRSFNAIGNPTFEVDQRNVGNAVSNTTFGASVIDRWCFGKTTGAMVVSAGQQTNISGILLPGTNFTITRNFFRVTLTTAQATLAAGDLLGGVQYVEGPMWRELQNDVHSLSLLVRSSVAGLAFSAFLADQSPATKSLCNLCTIPSANTWTLITLPNLPLWAAGGHFTSAAGSNGYQFGICLAAGSTYMTPANGTWQNGNFLGAVGQSNFAASPVNSTFDIAYVCHEPGASCSNPPIDCPFTQNLDSCLRYYEKSLPYGTIVGSPGVTYAVCQLLGGNTLVRFNKMYRKAKAKVPTVTIYNGSSGAAAQIYQEGAVSQGATGVSGVTSTTEAIVAGTLAGTAGGTGTGYGLYEFSADTGW